MSSRSSPQKVETIDDFLAGLSRDGVTVAEWARRRRLPPDIVYQVLAGRLRGCRGVSRKVIAAMGLDVPAMSALAGRRERSAA